MRSLVVGMVLLCTSLISAAADDSIIGTHWVEFQPVQAGGSLTGCQLVFLAVTADRVYLNGNPVGVNGTIALQGSDNNLLLMLKAGLKDLTLGTPFERPAFAYLQTPSASTAKAEQQSADGEGGYKLFVYRATDEEVLRLLQEMMDAGKVTIGYNRKKGGLDVLVPLDLTVVGSEYTKNEKVLRKHSYDALTGFTDCCVKVIEHVVGKQE
jgi:hypothetical protein